MADSRVIEHERVFASRMEAFLRLGFTPLDAELLAESSVDWHDAARLLDKGCCHALAFEILI